MNAGVNSLRVGGAGIPRVVKIGYAVWLLVYFPVYLESYGWENFLWFCNASNLLIGLAIFIESTLLLSAVATAVLLPQLMWIIDFGGRILLGFHPIGGTEYMLDPQYPLLARILSCYHVVMPVLIIWLLKRQGYDRRGPLLQTAIAWMILPLSYWLADPAENVNWLWRPFNVEQTLLPPLGYLIFALVAYPLVLYLPTHLALSRWLPCPRQQSA